MDRVTLECHGVATVIFMASPATPTAHPSRQTDQARAAIRTRPSGRRRSIPAWSRICVQSRHRSAGAALGCPLDVGGPKRKGQPGIASDLLLDPLAGPSARPPGRRRRARCIPRLPARERYPLPRRKSIQVLPEPAGAGSPRSLIVGEVRSKVCVRAKGVASLVPIFCMIRRTGCGRWKCGPERGRTPLLRES
jgi:hypothetical protein